MKKIVFVTQVISLLSSLPLVIFLEMNHVSKTSSQIAKEENRAKTEVSHLTPASRLNGNI